MKVKIKKLKEDAIIPKRAHSYDAGLDLYSNEEEVLNPNEIKLIKTGISIAVPEGYEAQVRPRSGLSLKYGITVLNSPGTIDSEYRGELGVILINLGKKDFRVEKNMRIAQLVFNKVEFIEWQEVEELDSTTRNESGFGSTGF